MISWSKEIKETLFFKKYLPIVKCTYLIEIMDKSQWPAHGEMGTCEVVWDA